MSRLIIAPDIRIFDRRTEEYGSLCLTTPHDEHSVVVLYDGALGGIVRDQEYVQEFLDYV